MAASVHQLEEAEYSHEDLLSLANGAVDIGLIHRYVLDQLTSLHPQVPVSMALRYLKEQCYHNSKISIDNFVRDARRGTASQELKLALEHAPKLVEILVNYASKWRLIGTALGFHCQDLDNIEASYATMVDSLKLNLIRLIEDWLRRKHLHTLPPTRSCLVEALRSHTVELGDVASELLTKELTSTYEHPVAGTALPYSIVQVDKDFKPMSATTELVQTVENKFVLLEVQCESKEANYCWLKNGHLLGSYPFLCVIGDIDMDGYNFSCRIQDCSNHSTTVPITLKVSCPLDKDGQSLASMYLGQPEVPEDTWPPRSSKTYINLAIIKQGEKLNFRSKYVHETIRNDMDDVFQQKEKIEYSDVLNSLKSGQVLFVEGRPGCGKTTFVNKITRDWAKAHDGPIRLVLLVSLRILNILYLEKPTLDLSDILQLFDRLEVSKAVVEERDGKGVCFIFDGLDEFSPSDGNKSIVFRIIQKSYLKQSTVIVASRPAATAKWRSKANKLFEVLGFLKEQILEYFDSYPFSEELKSAELREYLVSHPNILRMCYLPIHAAMVAYLYEVRGEIARTETEIYKHFTHCTLTRNLAKKGDIEDIDVTNLSGNDLFSQICELALEKTVDNKQVLQQSEVRGSSAGNIGDLGLITVDRIAGLYNFENVYTFLHLTFQEYLAAYHISTLTAEEQLELIDKHGDKVHMLVVWKFYCGLVKLDSTGGMFRAVMRKTAGTTLHKIQCAYESQQPIACSLVVESAGGTLRFENHYFTIPEFTALGYVLANNHTSLIAFSLIHCTLDVAGIDALLSETGSKTCLLQSLKYSSDSLDKVMLGCLEKLLPFCRSLQRLDLSATVETTQYSLETISSTIAKSCSNLTELSVSNILIGPSNVQYVLSECKKLSKIVLKNIIRRKNEFPLLVAELKGCTSLQCVKVSCFMSSDVTQTFKLCTDFRGVSLIISSHKIDLSLSRHTPLEGVGGIASNAVILDDCLSDERVSGCAEGIMCIRNLEELTVLKYCHDQVELLKLISNLNHQKSLKVLNLEEANLDAAGAVALSSSLKDCTTLSLRGNMIGTEGAEALSSGFRHWPNVRVLNLDGRILQSNGWTNIGTDGAKILSAKIQLCRRSLCDTMISLIMSGLRWKKNAMLNFISRAIQSRLNCDQQLNPIMNPIVVVSYCSIPCSMNVTFSTPFLL